MKKMFAILGALLLSTGLSVATEDDDKPVPPNSTAATPASASTGLSDASDDWDLFDEGLAEEASVVPSSPSASGPLAGMLAELAAHDKRADEELAAMEARSKALHDVKAKVSDARGVLSTASTSLAKSRGFVELLGAFGERVESSAADTYAWLITQKVGDHTPFAEVSDNVPAGLVRVGNLAVLPGDDASRVAGVIDLKLINGSDGNTTWVLSGGAGKDTFAHKVVVPQGTRVVHFVPAGKFSGDGTVMLISAKGGDKGGIADLTRAGENPPVQINLGSVRTDEKVDVSTGEGDRVTVSVSCAPAAALWMMKSLEGKSGHGKTIASLRDFVGRQVATDLGQVRAAHGTLSEFIDAKMAEVGEMMHALDAPASSAAPAASGDEL